MAKEKSFKRALVMAILSMVVCLSMFAGTTFAWFTDSVTSSENIIKAGNLDIELYYDNADKDDWEKFTKDTNVFMDELWEPGHTEVIKFKIVNEGSLALKYQFSVYIDEEVGSVNMYDNAFNLSDYILYGIVDGELDDDISREDAILAVEANAVVLGENDYSNGWLKLEPAEEKTLTMVVYMPTSVTNEANAAKDQNEPTINLGISLNATQVEFEEDSFGDDYDAEALPCDVLATPETIDAILASVEADTVIGLSAGYYPEIKATQDNLTFITNKAVVGFMNLNAKDGIVVDGVTFDQSGAKETYTFGNKQTATNYIANITGDIDSPKAADGVVVKNCKFTNTSGIATVAALEYIPVYFNEQGAPTERCNSITIENCEFAVNATQYIGLNYLAVGEVVVKNNVFGGEGFGTSHNTINATGNAANWTIIGNTFNNWNPAKTAIGSSKQGSNIVTWNVSSNKFNNPVDSVVIALKTSYNVDNSNIIFENNTALDGNATFENSDVDAENGTAFGVRKIVSEKVSAVVSDNAGLKSALANNATVFVQSGEYSLSSMANYDGITIIGTEGTVVGGENTSTGFDSNFGKNTTVKNVDFVGSTNGVRYSYAKGGDTVFEDCTFEGKSTYGFHIDQSNGATFTFNNCTFIGFNAFAGDLASVTFNNCTFLSNGNYGHTNIWSVGYFNNCAFGANTSVSPAGSGKLYFDDIEESYHHEYIGTAEGLVSFAQSIVDGDKWSGQKVVLVDNIDLKDVDWVLSTGFAGTFDGNGKVISNLSVEGENQVAFFSQISSTSIIKNVTFDNATVKGKHYVGVIVGWEGNEIRNATIENCTVINSTVICDTDENDDNGDKAGGIVGYAVSLNIKGCTVKNTTIQAYRDLGGIVGYAHKSCVITGNTVENITLTIDNDVNYKNYTTDAEHDANPVVGESATGAIIENNIVK